MFDGNLNYFNKWFEKDIDHGNLSLAHARQLFGFLCQSTKEGNNHDTKKESTQCDEDKTTNQHGQHSK